MAAQLIGRTHFDTAKPGAWITTEIGGRAVILNNQLATGLSIKECSARCVSQKQ